jgi:hypothetical protein
MSVSDGQPVNAAVTNAAFISRTTDSNTVAQVDLQRPASGADVIDVQQTINDEKAKVSQNQADIAQNQADIASNSSAITTLDNEKIDKVNPSTDESVPRHDGASGDLQDSGVLIDDSNNVTIPGNLTVNGTTTTLNTQTVDSEDANITVNKNGNQATADSEVSGITVEMSDATDARFGYDSTLSSRFKAGEVGSESEIITSAATQVLTSKDYDGGTASDTSRITLPSDTKANLDALTRKEGTLVYATDDDLVYYDDGTTLIAVGSGAGGSGSGRINFLDEDVSTFETGDGSVLFNDSPSYVDGQGGTLTGNLSKNLTTGANIVGAQSLQIVKSLGDASGDGVSLDSNTIDSNFRGRRQFIEFEYDFDNPQYTSGDFSVKAYDLTNLQELTIVGDTSIPRSKGRFSGEVLTDESTLSIRISLYLETDNSSGTNYFGVIDNVIFTIDQSAPSAIVTPRQSYSPVFTNLTVGNGVDEFYFWREGQHLRIHGAFDFGSTSSVTGNITMSIPSGLLIDGSVVPDPDGSNTFYMAGFAIGQDGGAPVHMGAVNIIDQTTFRMAGDDGAQSWNATTPFTWANGDRFTVDVTLPIEDWDSGTLISTTDQHLKTSRTSAVTTGPQSFSTGVTTTVDWTSVDFETTGGSFDLVNDEYVAGRRQKVYAHAQIALTGMVGGTGDVQLFFEDQNTTIRGFTRNGISANTESFSVQAVLDLSEGDRIKVRLNQANGGSRNISASSGVNYFQIFEIPDLSSFSLFSEQEALEAELVNLYSVSAADTWEDVTAMSIPLSPGRYRVKHHSFVQAFSSGSTTVYGQTRIALTNAGGLDDTMGSIFSQVTANDFVGAQVSGETIITIASPDTLKLQARRGNIASSGVNILGTTAVSASVTDPDGITKLIAEKL